MTAPMVSIKLRYVVEDIDRHGNVRLYFRRHGLKIRIREHLGTDAFYRQYAELMKAEGVALPTMVHRGPKPGTFRWLCVQFLEYTGHRILESMLDESIAPGTKETFCGLSSRSDHAQGIACTPRPQSGSAWGGRQPRPRTARRVQVGCEAPAHVGQSGDCCRICEPGLGWMAQLDVR